MLYLYQRLSAIKGFDKSTTFWICEQLCNDSHGEIKIYQMALTIIDIWMECH